MPLASILASALMISSITLQDPIVGSWSGYWTRQGDTLAVTMEVRSADSGKYLATFSSERLRVEGIPFLSLDRTGCCGVVMVLRGDASTTRFEGTLQGDTIAGTFEEGGNRGTFSLRRSAHGPATRSEEVTFTSGVSTLRGTLVVPGTAPPWPAIVMTHGSGAEGRWANRYLASRFANAGIAALIYDKRGVGGSTGDWRTARFEDLADDAAAAVAMLSERPDIRRERIGIYGHSQGGTILPLAAERARHLAFLIASAASGVPTDSAERYSVRNAIGVRQLSTSDAADANRFVEALVDVAYHGAPRNRLDSLVAAYAGRPWMFTLPAPDNSYWRFSHEIATYDAPLHWQSVKVPVLILFGDADERVPPEPSIAAITAVLKRTGAPVRVCTYPHADHTFRVRREGDAWPRNADGYLDDLVAWTRVTAGIAGSDSPAITAACQ